MAASAFAEPPSNPKIDRALHQSIREGEATQHVIISVKPGYRAEIRQALEKHGDRIKAEHPLIDALAADVHRDDVKELANHPWVLALSSDATVSAGAVPTPQIGTTPGSTLSTGSAVTSTLRETLGLARVATSTTLTGSTGIGVAIIDSGIAPNQDFKGRITGFYDFTRGGIPTEPFDDYGHGTHIAGLVGSSGIQSNYDFQGIAPSVHLIGLKVLDGTGQGSTSNVIKALEYVTANHAHLNVQIVNLSLGHPIFAPAKDDPLVQAVERAAASGLIVVASAGNFGENGSNGQPGYTGITSPGNAPSAITVGAAQTQNTITRDDDSVATFSSRGPTWYDAYAKPNVVAPGRQLPADTTVTSHLYKLLTGDRVNANNGQPLLRLSGTSMAAGVTSGVVALILDAHNRSGYHRQTALTPNLVKAILEFSAISVAGADSLTQGAGSINAAGAISLASAINTADTLNTYWLHTGVPGFNMIGTQQVAWGQNIVWGDTVLTGDLLYTNNIVWGDNIVWGTRVQWGSAALVRAANIVWGTDNVWGANIVWGDRVIGEHDGDNIVWGTRGGDNIVWGTLDGDNIVWGTCDGDNIVWGTADGDNIVWGTSSGDNIVWGSSREGGDNIVWGNSKDGDNIVWGSSVLKGGIF
jgi:serine protease AprX